MSHSPSCCRFDFVGGGVECAQIFYVIAATIGRGIQLEMNLVHAANEVHGQVGTVSLGTQSFRQPGGEAHLEQAAFASARTVVEPAGREAHVLCGLGSRFAEVLCLGAQLR